MNAPPDQPHGPRPTLDELRRERGVRFRSWSENEFLDRREDYHDLLSRSDADPLFMSWNWLTTWWHLHKSPFKLQLEVFAAEAEDGQLLGLAPMASRSVRHRGTLAGRRLEPLGNLWRQKGAVLTEYVTFPVDRSVDTEITQGLAESILASPHWDDICLSFMPQESDTWRQLVTLARRTPRCRVRAVETLLAHRIDLQEGFEAFLESLGPKTRLRVYNGRKRLSKVGPVEFTVADRENFEHCLQVLDRLHLERRGEPAFKGLRGQLYRRVAEMGLEDGSLALSHLAVGNTPIAAALNLRTGDSEYGVQFAMGSSAPKGVSPGYLQIGFMIEQACSNGIRYFDFLAGEERAGDYRRHFPTEVAAVGHAQVVRTRLFGALYHTYDTAMKWMGRVRKKHRANPPADTV